MPFQVSVLGFASPAVSPTNLLYDVFATPGGVYRYVREGRVVWPLAWAVIGGTPPGAFVGALLRVTVLFAPRSFGAFVGLVLLYFGPRLLYGALSSGVAPPAKGPQAGRSRVGLVLTASGRVRRQALRLLRPRDLGALARRRGDRRHLGHRGGGSIIAPFLATLIGTFLTPVAGVAFCELLAGTGFGSSAGAPVAPDWLLGLTQGVGELAGTYAGARLQRHVPEGVIRGLLGVLVAFLA